MHFLIRIAIRVFKIAIHAISIILMMFNMLKLKSRNVENNFVECYSYYGIEISTFRKTQ